MVEITEDNNNKANFFCLDCGCDTYSWEYYSVHNEIWMLAFRKDLEEDCLKKLGIFDLTFRDLNLSEDKILSLLMSMFPKPRGMLCIGCLEKRIGRRLTKNDFQDCPVNHEENWYTQSSRLQDRLGLEVKPDWENRKRREDFQKYLRELRVMK